MRKNAQNAMQDQSSKPKAKPKTKPEKAAAVDDTPKVFQRLMQFQMTGKRLNGLDDGNFGPLKKKRKRDHIEGEASARPAMKPIPEWEAPKILPGEHMSDFNARVNRELPIAGLVKKGKKMEGGLKDKQTRAEKKIQRKVALWREEEARRKEKEEDERDVADQEEAADFTVSEELAAGRRSKRSRRGLRDEDDDDDPWARLKVDRGQRAGLHDVVQAPPDFRKIPMQKFKVREGARVDVANVPGKAGSFRKREQLGDTRKDIIESYRLMMTERRGGGGRG